MAVYYLDTSAVVKRYIVEVGSGWVRSLTDLASGNQCWIATITPVEVLAAFYLRVRTGNLATPRAKQAELMFRQEVSSHYQSGGHIPAVLNRAMALVAIYPLRAYDAVHLASALHLANQQAVLGFPPVTFVSADQDLNQAAGLEGLPVEDPNLHP